MPRYGIVKVPSKLDDEQLARFRTWMPPCSQIVAERNWHDVLTSAPMRDFLVEWAGFPDTTNPEEIPVVILQISLDAGVASPAWYFHSVSRDLDGNGSRVTQEWRGPPSPYNSDMDNAPTKMSSPWQCGGNSDGKIARQIGKASDLSWMRAVPSIDAADIYSAKYNGDPSKWLRYQLRKEKPAESLSFLGPNKQFAPEQAAKVFEELKEDAQRRLRNRFW